MSQVIVQKEDGTEGSLSAGPDGCVYLVEGETVLSNPDGLKINHPTEGSGLVSLAKGIVILGLILIALISAIAIVGG